MARIAALAALLFAGCLAPASFECSSDGQCMHAGVAGTCEPIGACSFPDSGCITGRRYGDLSGAHANQCVADDSPDGGLRIDAPAVDANTVDAPAHLDGPAGTCPTGYAMLTGAGAHFYRKLPTAAPWLNQRTACANEGANIQLAVPDNAAELAAIVALAGAPAWIGITDAATEGTYLTVLGAPAPFLPWGASEPDNGGNQDCVRALHPTAAIETLQCATQSIAICECVP